MATSPQTLRYGTLNDLLEAMREEAYAFARFRLCAAVARRHGDVAAAELFEAVARVELEEHFAALAELAGVPAGGGQALEDAVAAEAELAETIYPEYAERAARSGDVVAAELFRRLAVEETRHQAAFAARLPSPEVSAASAAPAGQ